MVNYSCCYSSGRQFIFVEKRRWVFGGLLFVALGSLVFGLSVGVIVSLGGVWVFELVFVGTSIFVALRAYYLCFLRTSSSVDLSSYVSAVVLGTCLMGAMLMGVRYFSSLDLTYPARCALFSACHLVLGVVLYGYVSLCCQEDERKHHLAMCSPSGDTLAPEGAESSAEIELLESREALMKFLAWFFSCRWLRPPTAGPEEPGSGDETITVHNRTLKLIKVCLYLSDDMCCWIPYGGISGRCVGFIHAEQHRTFRPPNRGIGEFQLKVFQPGLFDKELACFSKACPGHSFAFYDVEGMVRRSRLLSSAPKARQPALGWCVDSSESEYDGGPRRMQPAAVGHADAVESSAAAGMQAEIPSGGSSSSFSTGNGPCTLKRVRSGDNLLHQRVPTSDVGVGGASCHSTGGSAGACIRRAAKDEVVVRNRSNQLIRALLFKSDDYCCMVPLVGHLMTCGDCILPGEERRFNPRGTRAVEFTLKVYSVGSGAKELTYLTVGRGHTYTFNDSLLS